MRKFFTLMSLRFLAIRKYCCKTAPNQCTKFARKSLLSNYAVLPLCYPCRNNKKRASIPVKGRKLVKLALRLTTRYCVPAYAASITAKLPSAPTVSEKSSGCNSGVIFGSALLAPGLHHTPARFAFGIRNVLSPSSSFVDEIVSYAHFPPFFLRCASLYIIIGKCP